MLRSTGRAAFFAVLRRAEIAIREPSCGATLLLSASEERASSVPWARVFALALSQLVAWGTLYYAFAVVSGPMGFEMGWTKAQMNGALSVGLGMCGFTAFGVGRWIDKHGGRNLMAAGAVLGALALALWSQVAALWQLYAVWILMGLAAAMTLYEAAFAISSQPLVRMTKAGYTASAASSAPRKARSSSRRDSTSRSPISINMRV